MLERAAQILKYPSGFWYRGKKKILMAHVDETCAIFDVSRLFTIFSMFT